MTHIRPPPSQASLGLVVIYAKDQQLLGQYFALDPAASPVSIGRRSGNTILLDSESISRNHARFERRGAEWWLVDSGSTNGSFINDSQVQSARLAVGDKIKVGGVILKLTDRDAESFIGNHYVVTSFDGLTGLYNRRHLAEQIENELARPRTLSVALFDLDRFKMINDAHGHLAGDQVLRHFAALAGQHAFRGEILARYGGEEFALLMPGTELRQAVARADALRSDFSAHPAVFEGQPIRLTVSAGICLASEHHSPTSLIQAVDQRLYQAKQCGRNRVVW